MAFPRTISTSWRLTCATLIAFLVTLGISNFSTAQSATPVTITITDFQTNAPAKGLAVASKAPASITLRGTYSSPTNRSNVYLELSIFGPMHTRSELSHAVANPNAFHGPTDSTVFVELKNVTPLTKSSWSLTFDARKYIGDANSGVYGFGVVERGTTIQTNILEPWFYDSMGAKPTNVALLEQITILNTHLADGSTQGLANDAAQLKRLTALVDSPTSVNTAIDASVLNWLNDLKNTVLSTQANQLIALIKKLSVTSLPLIYSHSNIQAISKNNPTDVATVIEKSQSSVGKPILYFLQENKVDYHNLKSISIFGNVLPVISNNQITGQNNETISAHATINSSPVLISDADASDCFLQQNKFRLIACLKSTVAMMTAQSPSVPRTVLITPPLTWVPQQGELSEITAAFAENSWGKLVGMNDVFHTPITNFYKQSRSPYIPGYFPEAVQLGNKLVQKARLLGTAFDDPNFTDSYIDVQLRSFSDLWTTRHSVISFISKNDTQLENIKHEISIQSSSTVTIANPKTQIPITIVNNSTHGLTIKVTLTSSASSQFRATPSDFVTIPAAQRVTIPISIVLSGTGSVNVMASLHTLENQDLGITKTMQVTSSAYQSLARTLVWGACGLLLLLVLVNGLRKRRNSTDAADEDVRQETS